MEKSLMKFVLFISLVYLVPQTQAVDTTTTIQQSRESVSRGSIAVLTIPLTTETINNVTCSVISNGHTRKLGNWTSGTRTPILRLEQDIMEIYQHRLTVSYQKNIISITLTNTTYSDSGIYTCQSGSTQRTDVDLQVVGGPFLISRSFPDSVTIAEVGTGSFEMTVCGNPKPSVKWALYDNTTTVDGVSVNSTHGLRSEHITKFFSLNTHCYRYSYITPKVYRQPCNLTGNYDIHGDSTNPIKGKVEIKVSFKPERLTKIRTVLESQCLHTQWMGPLLNPNHCHIPIIYDVEVVRNNGPSIVYKTYSNNFRICQSQLGRAPISDVTDVRIRYVNKFGHGDFASTNFVIDFGQKVEVTNVIGSTKKDDGNYKNIAITTSGLLGLFVLVIIVFITYYACANWNGCSCCCCGSDIEDGTKNHVAKYTVSKKVKTKNSTSSAAAPASANQPEPKPVTSAKTPRKSRIRKDNIIPKPKTLAQVTSHGLHKAHTFSGYDAFTNPHADETLQKGYMPLNTLQRRISESLAAVNAPPARVSSVPVFDDIFENDHVEDDGTEDRKRNSGASAETECTSLDSRTTFENGHASLAQTYSLDSAVSDFDMPYVIDLEKTRRKSIYDLPRSQTFHGGSRPNQFTPDKSEDSNGYSKMGGGGSQYGSEYALPSVALNGDGPPRDKRLSEYSSPRKSMLQLNIDEEPFNNQATAPKKLSFGDDKVVYDKPRAIEESVSSTPKNERPGFEVPVISQITGLYDTPRIHNYPVTSTEENHPVNTDNADSTANDIETASQKSSETLYDNINFILTKYGCGPNDTQLPAPAAAAANNIGNIYDKLPGTASSTEQRQRRGTDC